MASLVIAALPVHAAATILLAATSKFPIKAATTDVREDDFLRLPIGNVAIASLCKMRGYLELVADDGWGRGNGLSHVIVLIGERTDNGTVPVVCRSAAIYDYALLEKRELLGNGRRP
jgi:hypothetical protein